MAPRLRQLIKCFPFQENERRSLTLGDGVRLNPKEHRLELELVDGSFPVGAGAEDLKARTRLTKPESCRSWTGFFAVVENTKVAGVAVTEVRFRLNDGTQDLYFNDGAQAWVPSSPGNWNTEQEVADNIDKFQSQSLQVVIHPVTTDKNFTPFVTEVRVLYQSDVEFLEDYVGSFIQELRDNLRPIGHIEQDSDGAVLQFDLSKMKTPYDVVGVDSAYDLTADPERFNDLGLSFDPATKIATLPSPVPAGNRILIRFVWAPEVVITKSQEYSEIAKIPVLVFEDVTVENKQTVRSRPYVINKGTGQGFMLDEGYQADIRIPFSLITSKHRDLHVLQSELDGYFSDNQLLRSRAQDDLFGLRVELAFDSDVSASQKELYTGRFLVRIVNAVFYSQDAKPITGVKRFSVTGVNAEITN